MQKVVHASLHGNAYAVEEAGYEALRAYLEHAAAQLAADPDHEEILGDLEQAIADKCARHLGPHKSVVTEAEMKQVLDEMGPVGATPEVGPGGPEAAAPPPPPPAAPARRLYRVLEGGMLGGLCNGLGAYFGTDANIVRAAFVVLTLVTHGAWVLVYLVLMFVVPAAGTPEERAAASGLPFSAQELIDEAKRHYAKLEQELAGPWAQWRRGGGERRERRREARRAAREARRAWRAHQAEAAAEAPHAGHPTVHYGPAHYAQQVAAGLAVPVAAFTSAFLAVAWLQLSAQLIVTGRIFGWSPGLPLWASLLLLLLVTFVVGQPISQVRAALHRAPYPGGVAWLAAWDGILWLGFIAVLGWFAWHARPELSALAHDLPGAVEKVRASWQAAR